MSSGVSSRARTSAIRCLSIVIGVSGFLLSLLSVIISHCLPSSTPPGRLDNTPVISPRTRKFLKPKPRRMRFPAFPKPPDHIPIPQHHRSSPFSQTVPASRSLHHASRSLSSLPCQGGLSRNPLAPADPPAVPSHRPSKSVSHSPLQHYTPRLPSLDEEPLHKPLPDLPSSLSSGSTNSARIDAQTQRIYPPASAAIASAGTHRVPLPPVKPAEMLVHRRPRTFSSPTVPPLPPLPLPPTLPPRGHRARAKTVSASSASARAPKRRTKSLEKLKPLFLKSFASLSDLKARDVL
ncbi:hypothetical protein GLOTRDRAFT_128013 [Gloeophyllum trabeum ATCC 11539]|uniref:Uncharacterized protein n=1 Tax=Gloeophyllum trabeum (strain ATCC 11539 / FP-39264 / Madison 617) TaxID=670483 RepID=S7QCQ3_GLOTA|nr:uncharacterized protein GLOTRDRAFT_128013 [Gloeophyllum trabeum ATCC 11539]EPQ57656.1 hypothetical protein GLOTRDRAFT_128013 [Gloeophyllum trabeum ATCC 11539]